MVWVDGWGEVWPEGLDAVVGNWAEAVTVWEKAKNETGSATSGANPNFRIAGYYHWLKA
jgi:hypothetical protein